RRRPPRSHNGRSGNCTNRKKARALRFRSVFRSTGVEDGLEFLKGTEDPLSCFCRAAGIYFDFALKRIARRSGRKPTFLLGRLECTTDRLRSGSLCLDLEKIREAAERVARSEGLEIVDVEWKIGKQRFLRVYIDRVPKPVGEMSDAAGAVGPA